MRKFREQMRRNYRKVAMIRNTREREDQQTPMNPDDPVMITVKSV